MSRSTPTASRVTPTPTTTYSFTFTTYSTSLSSSSFSKPTIIPSMFSFAPAASCSANSMDTPLPSNFPIGTPWGLQAACVISNAREVNDHAFWDLYECCKGKDMTAGGSPAPCTAQCVAEDGQTWQELGECLSKKVEVVVCSPKFIEIGRNESTRSVRPSATSSGTLAASGSASGSGAQASGSTGAANAVEVVHVKGVKAAVGMFVLLAAGSAAGMLL